MREPSLVLAVLGEGCIAEVVIAVVQAVVVDVVNYEMVRGVGDLAVHFDAFAVFFSNGVIILRGAFSEPGVLAEERIVFGIDDGELSAGKRYEAGCGIFGVGKS